jgi:hypothetical protein
MVRIPISWIPGLVVGFIITLVLSLKGVLDFGLFGTLMSMAIILGCALAGKMIVEFVAKKRNDGHSAEYVRRMKSIDEFTRQIKEFKNDGEDK